MKKHAPRIAPPSPDEYPEWFAEEIELVHYHDLLEGLEESFNVTHAFLRELPEEKRLYRYQPDKWTIKEMWQHVIDVERVKAYRALRYARGDKTVLHGFDQNAYARESHANQRDWSEILEEYGAVRRSSSLFFHSLHEEAFMRRGTAGRSELTVRAVGYLILGHELHHVKIIKQRYLASGDAANG
jgi:hypothetical protein